MPPLIKAIVDYGPLVAFFIAYQMKDLMAATIVLMIATAIALATSFLLVRKIPMFPLAMGLLVGFFGGLTIYLDDERFIKLKLTIVNALFAAILLGGLAFGKPLLKVMMESAMKLTDKGWRQLSLRWGLFFLFLAVLNEIVWRNVSTDLWVDFKVFGMFAFTVLFTLTQIPLMKREMIMDEEEEEIK